jgi:hypothetical protein
VGKGMAGEAVGAMSLLMILPTCNFEIKQMVYKCIRFYYAIDYIIVVIGDYVHVHIIHYCENK